jgi:flagellar capping protein FliD
MATTNPITLSGFNGIDFNTIINAIIQADSQPLTDLQTQQQSFQSKDNAFVSLAGWIGNMESTVGSLGDTTAFSNVAATSSDRPPWRRPSGLAETALPSPAVQTRSLPLSLA